MTAPPRSRDRIWVRFLVAALVVAAVALGVVAIGVLQVGASSFAALMMAAGDSAEHAHEMFDASVAVVFGVAAMVAALLALLVAMLLARRLARPVERIADAARRLADGDLDVRVPEEGPQELRDLAAAYNAMADRLQEQEAVRREFIVNASHELRTPLTNLQGYLEALRDGVLPPDPATFDSLREEVDRLTRLASSLDVLAGAGFDRGPAGDVDVGATVRASADLVAPVLARRSIVLRVDAPAGLLVKARADELTQVLANLLQNAVRYTPSGGEVLVTADRDARRRPRASGQHRSGHPARGPAAGLGALLPRREVARPLPRRRGHRPRDRAPARRGRGRPGRRHQRGRLDDLLADAPGASLSATRRPSRIRHPGVIAPSPRSVSIGPAIDPASEPPSMLSFGDLLAAIYEHRVLAAIASAFAVAAILLVAWRAGWLAALRRRPRLAVGLLAAALVVGGPVTWYLASPLFIRTALVEPPVVAAVDRTPAPSHRPSPAPGASAPEVPIASVAPTPAPPTPEPLASPRSGEFAGTDDFHFGRGTATLIETAPGEWTIRLEDFSVRNGPDLFVYLSRDTDRVREGSARGREAQGDRRELQRPAPRRPRPERPAERAHLVQAGFAPVRGGDVCAR